MGVGTAFIMHQSAPLIAKVIPERWCFMQFTFLCFNGARIPSLSEVKIIYLSISCYFWYVFFDYLVELLISDFFFIIIEVSWNVDYFASFFCNSIVKFSLFSLFLKSGDKKQGYRGKGKGNRGDDMAGWTCPPIINAGKAGSINPDVCMGSLPGPKKLLRGPLVPFSLHFLS